MSLGSREFTMDVGESPPEFADAPMARFILYTNMGSSITVPRRCVCCETCACAGLLAHDLPGEAPSACAWRLGPNTSRTTQVRLGGTRRGVCLPERLVKWAGALVLSVREQHDGTG
jgi:hypothetical protein